MSDRQQRLKEYTKLRTPRRNASPTNIKSKVSKSNFDIKLPKSRDVQDIILNNFPRFLVTSRIVKEEKLYLYIYDIITKKTMIFEMFSANASHLESIQEQLFVDPENERLLELQDDLLDRLQDDKVVIIDSFVYDSNYFYEEDKYLVGKDFKIPMNNMGMMFLRDAFLGQKFRLPFDRNIEYDLSILDNTLKQIKKYFKIVGNNW